MGNKQGSFIGSTGPVTGSSSGSSLGSGEEVDLSGKGFAQFPAELKEKVNGNAQTANRIVSLSLASNSLTDVEDLKALKGLHSLDLSRNRIAVISEELFVAWSALESLNVSNNKLTTLPFGAPKANLRNTLITLNASNNQLSRLADELGDYTALKTLNLSYNQLKQLNHVWKSLSSLQTLHLNNNQLTEISGSSLESLAAAVTTINAAENRLTKLPPEIGRLTNLTKLYLNNNQLKEIPSEIGQLRQLKELNLRNNKLTDLPSEIANLWKLAVFDIEENPWPREEFFYELPELLAFLSESPRRPAKKTFGRGAAARKGGASSSRKTASNEIVSPKDTAKKGGDGFEVQAYRKRLFHVKGKHDIFVREVECKYQSFNQGDVFILDSGPTIFVWMGEDSNDRERAKGSFFSKRMSEEECGSAHVLVLDAANNEDSPLFAAGLDFWNQLGGKISLLSADEGGDDEEAEANWPSVNRLFKVTETGDRLDIEVIVGNDDLLSKSMLDSNHCFVLDCYSSTFVWAGSGSTANEKSWALLKAEELQSRPRPSSTGINWIMDGDERITFRENFYDWIDQSWQNEIPIVKQDKENKRKLLKTKSLDELLASPANSVISSPLQPMTTARSKAQTISFPTMSKKSTKETAAETLQPLKVEKTPSVEKTTSTTSSVEKTPVKATEKTEKTGRTPKAEKTTPRGRRATVASKPQETALDVSKVDVQQQMFSLDLAIKGEVNKQQEPPQPQPQAQPVTKRWPSVATATSPADKRKQEQEEKQRKEREERERREREAREKKEKEDREKREKELKEKKEREERERKEKEAEQRRRQEAEAEEKRRREQLQKEEQERLKREEEKKTDRQQQFKAELQRKESQLQLEKEADKKKEEARQAAVEKEQKDKKDKEDIERLEKFRREIDARLDQIKKEYEQKQKADKEKRVAKLKAERQKSDRERHERDDKEKKAMEEKLRKEREERERREREERERKEAEEKVKKEKEEKERAERQKKEELEREERERKAKELAAIEANETPAEKRERLRRERDERESKMLKEQQERIEKIRKEKEEQERLAREEKDRLARERAELMAKLEADKKAREERERQERLARRRALESTKSTPETPEEQPVASTMLRGPTRAAGPKRRVAATRNPVRALAARAEASASGTSNVSEAGRAAAAGAGGLLWSVGGENALSLWKKKQEDRKAAASNSLDGGKPQRLYHIKGRRNPFVREVQFTWTSLNKGDVFVVDDGGSIIYQWNGSEANRIEKGKGLDFAKKLKDKEHAGRPKIVVVEDNEIANEPDHHMWKILGKTPKDTIDPADSAGDDQEAEKKLKDLTTLYIVNPEGAASVDDIELEVIEEYPLMKEMLLPSQSYILDCVGEIFPWTGKKSTVPSRNAAMSIAKKMVDARDFWVSPIKRELEGGESVIFKEKFANWSSTLPIQMKLLQQQEENKGERID
eukprot:TRINITY_DN575_c0_g3_i3.p1 TRINITY_DN575_c0_g3~~TRINITY_DN575_c0_g3_i3.p1  ORF type:complete len:1448 (-),score=605.83 TRINITY_DN575_c0_g3_i3:34-4377(-)